MVFPDRKTASALLTILLFAIVLAVVYVARTVIVIFAFSILFAYLINPIVRFLQRHSLFFKNLRGPHVVEAYLTFIVLLALVFHGLDRKSTRLNSSHTVISYAVFCLKKKKKKKNNKKNIRHIAKRYKFRTMSTLLLSVL